MGRGNFSCASLLALTFWISLFFSGAVPSAVFASVGLLCSATAITLLNLQASAWRRAGLAVAFVGLGMCLGLARIPQNTLWHRYPPLLTRSGVHTAIPLDRISEFRGVLCADSVAVPAAEGTTCRYIVRLEQVADSRNRQWGSGSGKVMLLMRNGPMLLRGRTILVRAGLEPMREPGRVSYLCRADAGRIVAGDFRRRVDEARAGIFAGVLDHLRALDPRVSALASALLLGRREELDSSVYDRFRTAGSLHLLALSGLHLGILLFFLYLLLRFLPDQRLRGLIAAGLLLGYVFLVGWRPSLERALVMLLFASVGYTLDRDLSPLNLLGLAASVLLLLRPHYAYDLSFQLSFLSLTGILILSPFLQRLWQPFVPGFAGWPLAVALSAQIATAALVVYHFGALYPVGVAAALVLIPLITVFLGLVVGFLIAGLLSAVLSGWIAAALLVLNRMIDWLLSLFSRTPALYLAWKPLYWGLLAVLLIPLAVRLGSATRMNRC